MEIAIKKHFRQNIKQKTRLTGGYSFNTWLIQLESDQKLIFRSSADYETSGGRKIIISEIFKREKFFYDNVNRKIEHICPEVYIIDDSCEYYKDPFQISQYFEGTPLNQCINGFSQQEKKNIYYKIGKIAALINKLEIEKSHKYISSRISWETFFTERLYQRMLPLVKNNIITISEIDSIIESIKSKKSENTFSFLHLDMRLINMIYNNGNIYVLDAENCEFGDPLFEIAAFDVGEGLNDSFLNGYKSIWDNIVFNDLFYYYKMERLSLIMDVYINEVNDNEKARYYLPQFYDTKKRLFV